MRMAFPDLHFTVEGMIAEDDKLVTRRMLTDTHQGEFMVVVAIGQPIKVTGIWIHRIKKLGLLKAKIEVNRRR